jgi:hypothetical protein
LADGFTDTTVMVGIAGWAVCLLVLALIALRHKVNRRKTVEVLAVRKVEPVRWVAHVRIGEVERLYTGSLNGTVWWNVEGNLASPWLSDMLTSAAKRESGGLQ